MRTLLYLNILVITCLASVCNSSAQTRSDQINIIRKEFQAINADTTLKKVTLENEEFLGDNIGDGGGKLTGFYKDKSIKKILLWLGRYYFQNQKLISKSVKGENRHDDEVNNPAILIDQVIEHLKCLTQNITPANIRLAASLLRVGLAD